MLSALSSASLHAPYDDAGRRLSDRCSPSSGARLRAVTNRSYLPNPGRESFAALKYSVRPSNVNAAPDWLPGPLMVSPMLVGVDQGSPVDSRVETQRKQGLKESL